jgi:putative FmdB family regulatory protein
MPLYDYRCPKCGKIIETVQLGEIHAPLCCGEDAERIYAPPALIRIKGNGYPSRRKWMDNWTPQSEPFSIGSIHGERY